VAGISVHPVFAGDMRPATDCFQRSVACHHHLYSTWNGGRAKDKKSIFIVNVNFSKIIALKGPISKFVKGIVSPDWKGLQMVSLDRFEV
jgi:hypothetical protein